VYLSWGYDADFSAVKEISASELVSYSEGDPVSFRDGSMFRGTTLSLGGKDKTAAFYVEDGKLRPIVSSEIYQSLFNDVNWSRVTWVPDDLLSKFAYPMGDDVTSSAILPNGCLIKYQGTNSYYLIEDNKKRAITLQGIIAGRYDINKVVAVPADMVYADGAPIIFSIEPSDTEEVNNLSDEPADTLLYDNITFLKSYRLLASTQIKGIWPTKDGGYIVSGITDPNIMMIPPDGFVAKLDKQGNIQWLKLLKTKNSAGVGNPLGEEDVQSIIELKNGGYLMASKVWGFITTAESSAGIEVNKILFTKLDKNGNMIWNKSFTAFVEDARNSLIETSDNGFIFYAPIVDLAPSERGEDSDVYQDQPFASLKVFKLNSSGSLEWSKNIKNFISRKNDSYLIQAADEGYILAGDISEPNSEKNPPYDYDTYPGIAKFDQNFNFEWAKSLEGIPEQIPTVITDEDGFKSLGYKSWRMPASDIKGVVQAQDGGYLVFGDVAMARSLNASIELGKPYSRLIIFKFDIYGNLIWAKKLTFEFNLYSAPMTDFSLSPASDQSIFASGSFFWADDDFQARSQAYNNQLKLFYEKYKLGEEEKTAESRADLAVLQDYREDFETSLRSAILTFKVDSDLNLNWAKVIHPQRSVSEYALKAAADGGAIIAGEYQTQAVRSVSFGNKSYYVDGLLIKMDTNGNVNNDENNWISDHTARATVENVTPYVTSSSLIARPEPYSTTLKSRQPEFTAYAQSKIVVYAPFSSTSKPTPLNVIGVPASLSTISDPIVSQPTVEKTWPQINYERAISTETINDKSSTIHQELLPILNQLYDNQVKLTDNMGGAMLDYIFARVVTADDVIAVKKYLEGKGYKTQDESTKQLTMYKVGYFLTLTFSTNNEDKAFLEVTY
jgi:hypothetical protein